jgi:hypothetical protein
MSHNILQDQEDGWGLFVDIEDYTKKIHLQDHNIFQTQLKQKHHHVNRGDKVNYIFSIYEKEEEEKEEEAEKAEEEKTISSSSYIYSCLIIGISVFAIFI